MTDAELRRREALRRLRAPQPLKDERFVPEPSYIEGEEIYIPASWRCDHCDTRRPVPERLAVRGSSVATARRLVGMYKAWDDLRELFYRDQLPELRRPSFLSWPSVCVWCLERDTFAREHVTLKLHEMRQKEALRRLTSSS